MSDEREELVREISRISEEMFSSSGHGWRDEWMELDLTLRQMKVLLMLFDEPPTRMSTLAEGLKLSSPSCTGLVDRLVKDGWVGRVEDPLDRRLVLCTLTEQGQEVVSRVWRSGQMHREAHLQQMTLEELRIVVKAMAIFQRTMATLENPAATDFTIDRDAT